jgi:hypothetical protein
MPIMNLAEEIGRYLPHNNVETSSGSGAVASGIVGSVAGGILGGLLGGGSRNDRGT